MPILCPDCHRPISKPALACPEGHKYHSENGVLVLLGSGRGEAIRRFNREYFRFRASQRAYRLEEGEYEPLPYGQQDRGDDDWRLEWRLRTYDWELVQRLLAGEQRLEILEIGAWNGWLSHRLASLGHSVTAVDFFNDKEAGLGAKKHYQTDWTAIQMDLDDLSVLDYNYDVILVNRCLQFFADPIGYLEDVRGKLLASGRLILTGLQFLRDPGERLRGIGKLEEELQNAGADFFKPVRGYLDLSDRAGLKACGVKIAPYRRLVLANLKSLLVPTAPWHGYGLAKGTGDPHLQIRQSGDDGDGDPGRE